MVKTATSNMNLHTFEDSTVFRMFGFLYRSYKKCKTLRIFCFENVLLIEGISIYNQIKQFNFFRFES